MDVAVCQVTVGQVDVQCVKARGIELALVVGEAVEDATRCGVCDAREAADRSACKRRARRHDRLPEELQTGRLRAVARARSGAKAGGKCGCGRDCSDPARESPHDTLHSSVATDETRHPIARLTLRSWRSAVEAGPIP